MISNLNIIKQSHICILNLQKKFSFGYRKNIIKPYNLKLLQIMTYNLIDLTAIHFPMKSLSILPIYIFTYYTKQVLLLTLIKKFATIFTASKNYFSALITERECYEMYGIIFSGHIDLRKLLLDYNANYNPLLKYFPLTGFSQIYYTIKKHILYVSLSLMQEFRMFNRISTTWLSLFISYLIWDIICSIICSSIEVLWLNLKVLLFYPLYAWELRIAELKVIYMFLIDLGNFVKFIYMAFLEFVSGMSKLMYMDVMKPIFRYLSKPIYMAFIDLIKYLDIWFEPIKETWKLEIWALKYDIYCIKKNFAEIWEIWELEYQRYVCYKCVDNIFYYIFSTIERNTMLFEEMIYIDNERNIAYLKSILNDLIDTVSSNYERFKIYVFSSDHPIYKTYSFYYYTLGVNGSSNLYEAFEYQNNLLLSTDTHHIIDLFTNYDSDNMFSAANAPTLTYYTNLHNIQVNAYYDIQINSASQVYDKTYIPKNISSEVYAVAFAEPVKSFLLENYKTLSKNWWFIFIAILLFISNLFFFMFSDLPPFVFTVIAFNNGILPIDLDFHHHIFDYCANSDIDPLYCAANHGYLMDLCLHNNTYFFLEIPAYYYGLVLNALTPNMLMVPNPEMLADFLNPELVITNKPQSYFLENFKAYYCNTNVIVPSIQPYLLNLPTYIQPCILESFKAYYQK